MKNIILDLPRELLSVLFTYLDGRAADNLCMTNRYLHEMKGYYLEQAFFARFPPQHYACIDEKYKSIKSFSEFSVLFDQPDVFKESIILNSVKEFDSFANELVPDHYYGRNLLVDIRYGTIAISGSDIYDTPFCINFLSEFLAHKEEKDLELCTVDFMPLKEPNHNIEGLYVKHLRSGKIPTYISDFKGVKYLEMDGSFTYISKDINFDKLENLEISSGYLYALPFSLLNSNMTIFKLWSCGLKEFPSVVLNMKNLIRLCLYGNEFEDIPEEINTLNKLKCLDLTGNKLKSVSPKLAREGLKIGLWGNPLEVFPAELVECECIDLKTRTITMVDRKRVLEQVPKQHKVYKTIEPLEFIELDASEETGKLVQVGFINLEEFAMFRNG